MPKTSTVRSRTAAAMTRRVRFHDAFDSLRDSTATNNPADSSPSGEVTADATSNPAGSSSRGKTTASNSRGAGKERRSRRGRSKSTHKDANLQTLSCKGCGQMGHTADLCDAEVTSKELVLACNDCTHNHSYAALEKSMNTASTLCTYHFNRLNKSTPVDPKTLQRAKFLLDRVEELQTATQSTLEDSLTWLGVTIGEYEQSKQIAESEVVLMS